MNFFSLLAIIMVNIHFKKIEIEIYIKMKRELLKTADGSMTIFLPEINEHYHSKHGALQEAQHVFINKGYHFFTETNNKELINIMEIGFGTGLNCLLTFLEAAIKNINVNYTAVEAYPVAEQEWRAMKYDELILKDTNSQIFEKIHEASWDSAKQITDSFMLNKQKIKFEEITEIEKFDLIYFDAFGPRVQPELWTENIFEIMYKSLKKEGVLVTYSAKGSVRRAMQSVGFSVERLEGPPGKREMLRSIKI